MDRPFLAGVVITCLANDRCRGFANTVYDVDSNLIGRKHLETIRSCCSWRVITLGSDHVLLAVRRLLHSVTASGQ